MHNQCASSSYLNTGWICKQEVVILLRPSHISAFPWAPYGLVHMEWDLKPSSFCHSFEICTTTDTWCGQCSKYVTVPLILEHLVWWNMRAHQHPCKFKCKLSKCLFRGTLQHKTIIGHGLVCRALSKKAQTYLFSCRKRRNPFESRDIWGEGQVWVCCYCHWKCDYKYHHGY